MLKRLLRYLLLSIVVLGFILPYPASSAPLATTMVVEVPKLIPAFNSDCPTSYWYPFLYNGKTGYLTLNADAANSTNQGEWRPTIPQSGYYRVEAYIPAHPPITWCTGSHQTIEHDTTEARYAIRHASGESSRTVSQHLHSNEWIDLGEYYFTAGTSGYVYLSDLNGEVEFTTTVSFSAMRFTFTRLTRPKRFLALVQQTDPSGTPPTDTGVIQAQGFDTCSLPSIAKMQTWWNYSPYSFYALYIGGIHLPDECARADASWVSAVHQQGWSFVPTWVGPQAPCTDYHYRMSQDPAVAYQEGRQEAQAASSAAASIGLARYGLGGTIIYYDLEAYGVSTSGCRQPVAAFMNGWTERLHELGNLSGSYGAHNSYPWDWAATAHVPDAIWPASLYTINSYDPYASVDGIAWLLGLWTNHQRIRQYTYGHTETWGNIKNNIDNDVADGIVAMPSTIAKPKSIPVSNSSPPIEDAGWISPQQGWLISGTHLLWTADQGQHWSDISPGPVRLAYFLPSGEAWALTDPIRGHLVLYATSDGGNSWKSREVDLPPAAWSPIQLQFTSPTSGWMVIQKQTSQAFSLAILMKTTDAGKSWQSYDLPAAGSIDFVSPAEAWLYDPSRDKYFHSLDGGLSWVSMPDSASPLTQASLPVNTTLSGWHGASLGWSATSTGTCQGDPSSTEFACQVENALWQSQDGGSTWLNIALPQPAP